MSSPYPERSPSPMLLPMPPNGVLHDANTLPSWRRSSFLRQRPGCHPHRARVIPCFGRCRPRRAGDEVLKSSPAVSDDETVRLPRRSARRAGPAVARDLPWAGSGLWAATPATAIATIRDSAGRSWRSGNGVVRWRRDPVPLRLGARVTPDFWVPAAPVTQFPQERRARSATAPTLLCAQSRRSSSRRLRAYHIR